MAKKPVTAENDPASLAFSAVENALKESMSSASSAGKSSAGANKPDQKSNGDRQSAADRIAQRTGRVANDDRFSPAKLMYGMNAKPSSGPFVFAAIASIIWAALTLFIAWTQFGSTFSEEGAAASFFQSTEFAGLLAVLILPIIGFFAVALLARRAQDLRIAATSMTSAAVRLAEPETTAADKVASVGQAVRREVTALADGLERALSRAGELEVMIHNEVTALDKTYTENESRMRGLIQELASQRDSVITNSERVREAISESHSGLVFDLDMIAQRIAGTIEERGGELTKSLNVAGDNLQSQFSQKTQSFVSMVDNRTNDLLSALDDSAGRLNLALEDRTSTISNAFEDRTQELASVIDIRMSGITEALDSRAVALNEAIEERTASISSVLRDGGGKILSDLRDRGHEVGSAIDAIGLRIANEISGRAGEAEETLTRLTQQLDEMVSTQLNAMDSRVQSAMLEISGAVDESAETARAQLLAAGTDSLAAFDGRVNEVAVMVDSRLSALDIIVGDKGQALTEALDRYTANFAERANLLELALDEKSGRFTDQVAERTQEMAAAIESRSGYFTQTIEATANQMTGTMESTASQFAGVVESSANKFSGTIENRTALATDVLQTQADRLASTIEDQTNIVTTSLRDQTEQFTSGINTQNQIIAHTLGNERAALEQTLQGTTESISSAIATRTRELASEIDTHGIRARDSIEASLNAVTDTMDTRSAELTQMIGHRVAEVNASLGQGIDSALSRISDAETGIAARVEMAAAKVSEATANSADLIESRVEVATSTVNEAARVTAQVIETGVNSARKAITDMVDQRLGTLPEAITARADQTAQRLNSLNENINSSMSKSLTDLESSAERIEKTISSRIVEAASGISQHVAETANSMDMSVRAALEAINEVATKFTSITTHDAAAAAQNISAKVEAINEKVTESTDRLSRLVSSKSDELTKSFDGQVARVSTELDSQSKAYVEQITSKSDELASTLAGHNNILREALAASAQEAQALMSTTTSRISSEINVSLDRLNESNRLLQNVIQASTGNLAELERSIAAHTSDYSEAVRKAVDDTHVAGDTMTRHVDAIQTTVRSMVEQFSTIVGQLEVEASQVDASARNLSEAGQASLANVEMRREAMDALAQGFADRTNEIDAQLRQFAHSISETVGDTERRLVSARAAMDEALSSTSQSVSQRLEELAHVASHEGERTSDALRQTQQSLLNDMQRALADATTRFEETANAMQSTARQVGTELEATRNELQRGFLELPEETRASAAAMRSVVAEQIEALNELNAIVSAQPRSHDVSRGSFTPAQPALSQPEPRPVSRADTGFGRLPETPAPMPTPAPAPAPVPRQDDSAGNGWLKDVLRNASQASGAPAPRANNLTSLTAEIARAIDEHALAEAWERYQSGQSNVFSRRIYTLSGQGTFDDVRKRLQRDRDFDQTARDYIAEFEQVIKRARSAEEARHILVSDEGKVFTMLAHASGRLN
ncbi:MAG: hypothetical protein KDJ19_01835 [Hyphomicrobiaceae bacterium]|nr:hypothetical protein [Hyphomicrobiaceae bacterium]MCC0024764.1 hypothetical protein [Hyphomicrobiaceae bacterium]